MLAVAAALIRRGDRILVSQRLTGKPDPLKWEFPGGKLEQGESPEAALERELREELGIETRTGRLVKALRKQSGEQDILLLFYESRLLKGEPEPLQSAGLRWETPGQLLEMDLADADRSVAQALAREEHMEKTGIWFITGGARSGKSSYAERIARGFGDNVLYIATARAFDDEMRERIKKHRAQRPSAWPTYEGINGFKEAVAGRSGAVLLDCVTILITNIMMDSGADWDHPTPEDIENAERTARESLDELLDAAKAQGLTLILASNELGMGLVPVYAFGRAFRDVAGRINQYLASRADYAVFMVSGLPIELK